MKYVYLTLLMISLSAFAKNSMHDHKGEHAHQAIADKKESVIDPTIFNEFISDLSDAKIVVASVKGLVCDFCARGIEKTFKKDKLVKKIDVYLGEGKVLIAYNKSKIIDLEVIKKTILSNGQTVISLKILEV